MFGDFDDFEPKANAEKTAKIYINGNPLLNPVTLKVMRSTRLRDIQKLISDKYPNHFKRLRLFNQEGVELNDDDIEYIKNGATLFASAGEDFDSNSTFSEYDMIKELGEGGFGKVLLGVHRITKEKVAIKLIKTSLIGNAQDIDMVFREAEIMKSLDHKNIVKIKNCFTLSDMQVVFVMEYLQGGELLARVEEKGSFNEEQAKIYFRQLVDAMTYCHRNNLIHRDLKLENILLVSPESDQIKVVDFGIAGCSAGINLDHLDAGSLRYMAPEVLEGKIKKLTSAVDIWAMGVILYSIVIGELPFAAESNLQIKDLICQGNYIIPPAVAKNLSAEYKDALRKMLEVNPEGRISAVELQSHPWLQEKSSFKGQYDDERDENEKSKTGSSSKGVPSIPIVEGKKSVVLKGAPKVASSTSLYSQKQAAHSKNNTPVNSPSLSSLTTNASKPGHSRHASSTFSPQKTASQNQLTQGQFKPGLLKPTPVKK